MTRSVDLRGVENLDWRLFEVTDHYRRWTAQLDDGRTVMKTEYLGDAELVRANQELLRASEGKRWGDGQVVGRIPLNVLYSSQHQIAEKLKEGDRDHIRWWLNSEHALPYRTFKGKI
ncbi:MAG: hypothetical protein AAAC47_07495 [Pararhizobium sp.]